MKRAARVRVGQFLAAVHSRAVLPDDEPARALLAPELYELFRQMPPEDKRHGLEVVSILRAKGATDDVLLQAGLLHDVGKANAGVGLHHRILRVLLRARVAPLWRWLAGRPTGWRRPFWVIANHPERGAVWVGTTGADPELVELIRFHEADAPESWSGGRLAWLHEALAEVDARC